MKLHVSDSERQALRQAKKAKIAKAVGRSVDEWVGKTPDEQPPPHVRLRVFRRFNGVCHITKRKIRAGEDWQCDHVVELEDGGANRENNLAPALVEAHSEKTQENRSSRAKADRIAKKHTGIWPESKFKINGRGFSPGRNNDPRLVKERDG